MPLILDAEHQHEALRLLGSIEAAFGNICHALMMLNQAQAGAGAGSDNGELSSVKSRAFEQALAHHHAGRFAEAFGLYRVLLAVDPDIGQVNANLISLGHAALRQAAAHKRAGEAEAVVNMCALADDIAEITGDFTDVQDEIQSDRLGLAGALRDAASRTVPFSIGITTFDKRFRSYFEPLLRQIRCFCPRVNILVCVNGNHNQSFDEAYRRDLLAFLARHRRTFPIVFPEFRGLAKMWNSLIVHSPSNHMLLLNDDVTIFNPEFFEEILRIVKVEKKSFKINGLWSHFIVNRQEIDEIGYFDERLLGVGGEDGDMEWRYINKHGKRILNARIPYVLNHWSMEKHDNIKIGTYNKYSAFNHTHMDKKYAPRADGIKGLFDEERVNILPDENLYPYERFYWERKGDL